MRNLDLTRSEARARPIGRYPYLLCTCARVHARRSCSVEAWLCGFVLLRQCDPDWPINVQRTRNSC